MKCIIADRCVKLFGRSIHCLSRIGDELFLEALSSGLALRTVNSSRSAYACLVFNQCFFTEYAQESDEIESSNPGELLKCKVSMKSVLAIFKSLTTIEKSVEHCKIEFKPTECRLIFLLYCHHGIVKTHNLAYQECESLQAVFSKELCPNLIQTQPKVLQDTVFNFPNSCEEISMQVSPDCVKVKNFVDNELSNVVYTEMTLAAEEFNNFQIGVDTIVTFCLKELRAVLSFSEFVNQPVSLHFGHTGNPIVFSLDSDPSYTGDFVMATLAESDSQSELESQNRVSKASNTQINNSSRKQSTSKTKNNIIENDIVQITDDTMNDQTVPNKIQNISSKVDENRSEIIQKKRTENPPILNRNKQARTGGQSEDFFTDSFPYDEEMLDLSKVTKAKTSTMTTSRGTNKRSNTSLLRESNQELKETNKNKKKTNSPKKQNKRLSTSMLRNTQPEFDKSQQNNRTMESILEDDDGDDDEILMGTPPPPSKRPTKNFFNSYEQSNEKDRGNVLLAADTDDEDD